MCFDFDFVIFSNEVFTRKPYKKIYDLAVQKSGFDYVECLFIDDDKKNLKTAEQLRIKTILFKVLLVSFQKFQIKILNLKLNYIR